MTQCPSVSTLYHTADSGGSTQADNFIETVEKYERMLPPVIDLEFYGDKRKNPPSQTDIRRELDIFIEKITEYYEMNPVIYATEESYSLYLDGAYEDCDIWIRSVYIPPVCRTAGTELSGSIRTGDFWRDIRERKNV